MQYTRVYSDEAGETHFALATIDMRMIQFAPPAAPMATSPFTPATRVTFLAPAAGWYGEPHPTPARQLFFCLAGEWEVTVSDGEQRRFGPGSVVLLDDTTGKGHATRIVSDLDALAAMVQLPADAAIAAE
jgi:hypothetical protein